VTPRDFDNAVTFTIGQLARLAGITNNRTLIRLLRASGVQVLRVGRRHVVERLSLKAALPGFYDGLVRKLVGANED